jgi:hypothetical protein
MKEVNSSDNGNSILEQAEEIDSKHEDTTNKTAQV